MRGTSDYSFLRVSAYRSADVFLACYSVAIPSSLDHIKNERENSTSKAGSFFSQNASTRARTREVSTGSKE